MRSTEVNSAGADLRSTSGGNAAYGLTPEEVALMWATAPPRMPFIVP